MNPDTIARDLARTADGGVAELAAGKLALKQRVERLRFGETFAFETILSGGTETLVQRKAALAFGSRRGQINIETAADTSDVPTDLGDDP